MTERDAALIRDSFRVVDADRGRAGRVFYAHLFEVAPWTARLFMTDVERQAVKLIATLGVVVAQVDHWVAVAPLVEELALRHLAYGVRPEDYPPVGAALQRMLREMLGEGYTPDVAAAWARLYDGLQDQMIAGAYGAPAGVLDDDP